MGARTPRRLCSWPACRRWVEVSGVSASQRWGCPGLHPGHIPSALIRSSKARTLPHFTQTPVLRLFCTQTLPQIESSPDFTNINAGLTTEVIATAACSLAFLAGRADNLLEVGRNGPWARHVY